MVKFGVVLTTYNRPEYLNRALKSILANNYDNILVCVINDGSSNNKEYKNVINKYFCDNRIIYYQLEINSGVNKARNIALDILLKHGCDYITFLDDDDVFLPTAIRDVYKIIKKTNKSWIVTLCKDENNNIITKAKYYGDMPYINYLTYVDLQGDASHFINSKIIGDIRFSENIKQGEEWTFFIQLSQKTNMYVCKKVTKIVQYLPDGLTNILSKRKRKEKRKTRETLDKLYLYPLGYTRKHLRRIYLKSKIQDSLLNKKYFTLIKYIIRYIIGI